MTIRMNTLPRQIFAFGALLFFAACGQQDIKNAVAETPYSSDDSFEVASTVGNDELSGMRGGFLFAGGFKIDFGLISITSVNGIVKSSLSISSNNFNFNFNANNNITAKTTGNTDIGSNGNGNSTGNSSTQSNISNNVNSTSNTNVSNTVSLPTVVQQLIQTGNNNSAGSPSTSTISNSFVTIVQNSANNAVIQNLNMLNLTLSNFSNFRSQASAFNNQFSTVRALH